MTAPATSSTLASWRRVGPWIGLALFLAAVIAIAVQRDRLTEAWTHLRDPSWPVIGVTLMAVALNLLLSGLLFSTLMRRFGRVGVGEMQALIAASTLLNFIPLRPGLFGRIGYHRAVNGIRAVDTARTIVESMALTVIVIVVLMAAVLAGRAMQTPMWANIACPLVIALFFSILPRFRLGASASVIKTGDVLVWGLRYWTTFSLIGHPIAPEAALALACAAVLASSVPLAGNGLGLREWVIGLLAPSLAGTSLEHGVAADLVHRAMEIVIVAPAGLLAIIWLSRRRRINPPATTARSLAPESPAPTPSRPSPPPPES